MFILIFLPLLYSVDLAYFLLDAFIVKTWHVHRRTLIRAAHDKVATRGTQCIFRFVQKANVKFKHYRPQASDVYLHDSPRTRNFTVQNWKKIDMSHPRTTEQGSLWVLSFLLCNLQVRAELHELPTMKMRISTVEGAGINNNNCTVKGYMGSLRAQVYQKYFRSAQVIFNLHVLSLCLPWHQIAVEKQKVVVHYLLHLMLPWF
jgi:hypothetical protein